MEETKPNEVQEPSENDYWGGSWTKEKIEIFIKYIPAYLSILNQRFKIVYFDGFAGSGKIITCTDDIMEGVALKVLSIDKPRSFDIYYLVDLCKDNSENLKNIVKTRFPNKCCHIVNDDCNNKLAGLAEYLKMRPNWRGLAFLDPFGMEIKFDSLRKFKNVFCDIWILIPSGGANRLLPRNKEVPDSWKSKISDFLGLTYDEIENIFYTKSTDYTLFGPESRKLKNDDSIETLIKTYQKQLGTIWNYVSTPYPLKNSKGAIVFHFLMVSQVKTAKKIADDIIKKLKV